MSNEQAKPKLIIDDDWKSRVQAEKEQLRQKPDEEEPPAEKDIPDAPHPPASFGTLVSMLVTQALTCLGQLPDPLSNQPTFRPHAAKHFIDTLGMLEQKTKGNLSPEESSMLTNVLIELRMAFVSLSSRKSGS